MNASINKPVLFKRPANWDTITDEERREFAAHLTLMGMEMGEGSEL